MFTAITVIQISMISICSELHERKIADRYMYWDLAFTNITIIYFLNGESVALVGTLGVIRFNSWNNNETLMLLISNLTIQYFCK